VHGVLLSPAADPHFTLGQDACLRDPGRPLCPQPRAQRSPKADGSPLQRLEKTIPPERWKWFLEDASTLKRILKLAGNAAVPGTYKMPNHKWHDLGEIK
jgi:hypothetical protein